jgi:hypothetical protein
VKAVRRALIAVSRDDPAGQVVPVEVLRTRVETLTVAQRQCEYEQVGRELPELIRDLHTTLAAGRDVGELLGVAVMLHVQGSHAFLHRVGAHPDLCWQAAVLARQAAREHGGADLLGLAAFGAANGLLAAGEFDMAQAELDSVTVPTTTDEAEQLEGMLALSRSLVAASDKRPGDVDAPLDHAAELAARTGEGNAYGLSFGPTNVGVWRMAVALEARDYLRAAGIAEGLRPELLPAATRRGAYWADYGRALARLRGRQDDAVRALRKAELISPTPGCNAIRSSVRYSVSCLCARAGTQSGGSCGGWPTGRVCRCSRSGRASTLLDAPPLVIVHDRHRDRRTRDRAAPAPRARSVGGVRPPHRQRQTLHAARSQRSRRLMVVS